MKRPQHQDIKQRFKMNPQATTRDIENHCGTGYAAKLLGLSVGTIQKLVTQNVLHSWKTNGGHRKITMASIDEYQRKIELIKPQPPSKDERLCVLLVEDDAVTRQMVQGYCTNSTIPVNCIAKASAMEAMIHLTDIQPDLLITDLNMPGIDGFELLRLLRQNPRFNQMALMVLTSLTPVEIQARGELPQGTICLHKPVKASWFHGFFEGLFLGQSQFLKHQNFHTSKSLPLQNSFQANT